MNGQNYHEPFSKLSNCEVAMKECNKYYLWATGLRKSSFIQITVFASTRGQLLLRRILFIAVQLMMIRIAMNSSLFLSIVRKLQITQFVCLFMVKHSWNHDYFTDHKHEKCLF